MNLSEISSITNTKFVNRQNKSQSTQDDNDNSSGGWKYVTVRAGGKVYTYIVIGKNMRVLIGESNDKEDTDKKNADNKNIGDCNLKQTNTTAKNVNNKTLDEPTNFLTDLRMLAMTGGYQKKMRETIKYIEDNTGYVKSNLTYEKKTRIRT